MKRIFLLAISLLLLFSLTGCIVKFYINPQITDGEFPFVLEYEIDGERYLIEDTVVCSFDGYDPTNPFTMFPQREWEESLKSGNEDDFGIVLMELEENTESVFVDGRINYEHKVFLEYGGAAYYMGDADGFFYKEPSIRYYEEHDEKPDVSFTTLTNEQLEEYFGIKIIRFEFSEPIENKFE